MIKTNNAVQIMEKRIFKYLNIITLVKQINANNKKTSSLSFKAPEAVSN